MHFSDFLYSILFVYSRIPLLARGCFFRRWRVGIVGLSWIVIIEKAGYTFCKHVQICLMYGYWMRGCLIRSWDGLGV
jgi:hypothetical protein